MVLLHGMLRHVSGENGRQEFTAGGGCRASPRVRAPSRAVPGDGAHARDVPAPAPIRVVGESARWWARRGGTLTHQRCVRRCHCRTMPRTARALVTATRARRTRAPARCAHERRRRLRGGGEFNGANGFLLGLGDGRTVYCTVVQHCTFAAERMLVVGTAGHFNETVQ